MCITTQKPEIVRAVTSRHTSHKYDDICKTDDQAGVCGGGRLNFNSGTNLDRLILPQEIRAFAESERVAVLTAEAAVSLELPVDRQMEVVLAGNVDPQVRILKQ